MDPIIAEVERWADRDVAEYLEKMELLPIHQAMTYGESVRRLMERGQSGLVVVTNSVDYVSQTEIIDGEIAAVFFGSKSLFAYACNIRTCLCTYPNIVYDLRKLEKTVPIRGQLVPMPLILPGFKKSDNVLDGDTIFLRETGKTGVARILSDETYCVIDFKHPDDPFYKVRLYYGSVELTADEMKMVNFHKNAPTRLMSRTHTF